MQIADLGDVQLHYDVSGDADGAPVVFSNSLNTDLRLWNGVLARLPKGLKIIRYDMRGHGLSSAPAAPYSMGTLVRDVERLMDLLEVRDAVFVGLSVGGMIGQGLAVKRLDLVRGLVLSNTGAKIGTPEMWADRIATVKEHGLGALTDSTMERWFGKAFRESPEVTLWRNMFSRQPVEGYLGCAAAISGTDFYTPTSGLRLPALGIAGSEDGSTPPDLVRETVALIPGSQFELIRKAGHLPCVDQPDAYADILTRFLRDIGHI
ncbi:3-oxoadipate enol-lactonase [Falsiphaeobacter marinintestinus]|uniref:3-oxoadipate enol-lactonase n=1 Tax=Falsiphaeobacter marinintestinus TaxID=1492905 RepID=UPI0011B408BC|nr:3-oxoadipate enol-lactonase [Phaeobacter marinintestinus]